MRKRNVHVQFWLDKKEAEAFNKKVKRSGLSREAYLRHLVNGLVPQDAPPPAYYDFMRELHRIGGNLNQIAQKAHVLGVIDERRYDEEMRKFDQLVRDITKAVILPKPMEYPHIRRYKGMLNGHGFRYFFISAFIFSLAAVTARPTDCWLQCSIFPISL